MKKAIRRLGALAAAGVIAVSAPVAVHAEEGYTYNYDWWGDVQYSPDAYRVAGVFTAKELGLDKELSSPEGLFVSGSRVYLCDTGNNRILELERKDQDSLELVRIIDSFRGGTGSNTFSGPTDVAVTEDGYLYVCDRNNGRILKLDMDLNYVLEFTQPVDATIDQNQGFLPRKISTGLSLIHI